LPSTAGSIAATVFFLLFFAAVCWFVYRRDRQRVYKHLEQLPLEEEGLS
jgi:cbb3-type cytochrome oxidase subunit 3